MKPLTVDFIKEQGFEYEETIKEDEFSYDCYYKADLEFLISIYHNYYNDGKVTFDVCLDGMGFIDVGEDELITLLKIIPKIT